MIRINNNLLLRKLYEVKINLSKTNLEFIVSKYIFLKNNTTPREAEKIKH